MVDSCPPKISLYIEPIHNWRTTDHDWVKIHHVGSPKIIQHFWQHFQKPEHLTPDSLKSFFAGCPAYYSIILETKNQWVAAVDHMRMYSIFYSEDDHGLHLSNDPRLLQGQRSLYDENPLGFLDFSTAGYVTCGETLYKNLYQIRPGNFLLADKDSGDFTTTEYFSFHPPEGPRTPPLTRSELGQVLDEISQEIAANAKDRPVLVLLSAGLDSRVVLGKLLEHGVKNIFTATYGTRGTLEAKIAKECASKVGVPWTFIPSYPKRARGLFESADRKKLWKDYGSFTSTPDVSQLEPLIHLRNRGKLPQDTIIINGQIGDLYTGGHVLKPLREGPVNLETFFQTLIKKHYSLWLNLLTPKNRKLIEDRILQHLGITRNTKFDRRQMIEHYENWEHTCRGCLFVTNQQLTYKFLGYDWELPLSDMRLLAAFRRATIEQKANQSLYVDYLKNWNYSGLFDRREIEAHRWPGLSIVIAKLAWYSVRLRQDRLSGDLMRLGNIFGFYWYLYTMLPYGEMFHQITQARNIEAKWMNRWLVEEGFPEGYLHALSLLPEEN